MRLCIDLDGTLCEFRGPDNDYESVRPLPGAVEFLRQRRLEGHTIIIHTARHMKSTGGNIGLVVARQGAALHRWLATHQIEYDELVFGKPHADVYIDDNAVLFHGNWDALSKSARWTRQSTEAAGKINIVVTMAGAGSRFQADGFKVAKSLIPVFGEPMYRHAVRSLPLHLCGKLIFIIRAGPGNRELREDIDQQFARYSPSVIEIDHMTRGQAETALYAEAALAFNNPTLVHNSDSAYIGGNFDDIYRHVDGALMVFCSDESRWSYARVGERGRVEEVREKIVISNHASTGTYFFRSSTQLFEMIRAAIQNRDLENGEYYIAPLYNKMIAAGQNIAIVPVSHFLCFGTPSDLLETASVHGNEMLVELLRSKV